MRAFFSRFHTSTLKGKSLASLLPVDHWPLSVLLWTIVFGVLCRAWRIVDFVWGADDYRDLWWLPKSIGVDLGFAVLAWALCALGFVLSRGRRHGVWLARLWTLAVSGAVLFFGLANVLSFHVSGSALTLHRLRGDDGATARDMDKFAWGDVWPVLAFSVLSILSLIAILALSGQWQRVSLKTRVRGLLAVLVVTGITLLGYQLLWDGRDRGYGRHPFGVFVESVLQEWGGKPQALSRFVAPEQSPEGWTRLFTPETPQNPPPGPIVRGSPTAKNVIVFFSEGVPWKHTSLNPKGPNTTPFLKARMQKEGLEMQRFYSPFHRSIQALFSLFCGEYPTPTGKSITELNPRIDCNEFSQTLAPQGMRVSLFHGGFFSFYDKTSFLGDRAYEAYKDGHGLKTETRKLINAWGVDERGTVEGLLGWIDTLKPEDRFASVLIPITAHYPFETPPDVHRPYGESRKIDRFLNAVNFLDSTFEMLMQGLEQRGLLDDTLVIFMADHGESPHEPPRDTNVDRAMYEYDVHIPMVMFQRKMFPVPQQSTRLAAIPDVLPTVIDALGLKDARVRQGQSFLADSWQERRVFLGAARSNVRQTGFLDGHRKYIFDFGTGRSELYDLIKDPEELHNVAEDNPVLVQKYQDTVLTYAKWQYSRIRNWPTLGESIDPHGQLATDFEATVIKDGVRTPCTPKAAGASARTCPGFPEDLLPGILNVKVNGRIRRCYAVRIPTGGGEVELVVRGKRDYFPFFSNMRVAFGPGRLDTDGTVETETTVDNDQSMMLRMTKRWRNRRHQFPTPNEFIRVRVRSDETIEPSPVCLFFGDMPWRPRLDLLDGGEETPQTGEQRADDGHDDLLPVNQD